MAKNLIVSRNPAKRRTSAKQRAAARRNIKKAQAANRRGRRRPAKRRTTKKRPSRRRNPTARRAPMRRSNPRRPTVKGILNDQVVPALVGGAGAVLDDILINIVPVPLEFKTGVWRHAAKAVGAIAIGYAAAMFLPKRTADQLGAGAMTVVGYNVVRDVAARFAPQLPLGEYLHGSMGEYLDPSALGFYGAGLNPNADALDVSDQFTRGTPYMGDGANDLSAWPTGGDYDEMTY